MTEEQLSVQWFVVDYADDYIYYAGPKKNCIIAMDQSYAGLMLVKYNDLTPEMKAQAMQYFI